MDRERGESVWEAAILMTRMMVWDAVDCCNQSIISSRGKCQVTEKLSCIPSTSYIQQVTCPLNGNKGGVMEMDVDLSSGHPHLKSSTVGWNKQLL